MVVDVVGTTVVVVGAAVVVVGALVVVVGAAVVVVGAAVDDESHLGWLRVSDSYQYAGRGPQQSVAP